MDIFLALKNADLPGAARFKKMAEQAALIVALFSCAALMVLFVFHTELFTLRGDILYQLWLYFLAGIFARTLFQGQFSCHRAAGTECYLNRSLAVIFLGLGLPLQIVAIFYLRANLPFVYLVDLLLLFSAGLLLWRRGKLQLSAVYERAVKHRLLGCGLLTPALWLRYFVAWRNTGVSHQLLWMELDARYRSAALRESLLEEIAHVLGRSVTACQIMPGILLYLVPNLAPLPGEDLRRMLLGRFGGHMRSLLILDPAKALEANLALVLTALGKSREWQREFMALRREAGLLRKDGSLGRLQQFSRGFDLSRQDPGGLPAVLRSWPGWPAAGEAPVVYFDGKRRSVQGSVTLEQLEFADRLFSHYQGQRMLNPPRRRGYVIFSVFGMPFALLSISGISGGRAAELQRLALASNLVLSVKLARELERAGEVPAALFDLFSDEIKKAAGSSDLVKVFEGRLGKHSAPALLSTVTARGERCLCLPWSN